MSNLIIVIYYIVYLYVDKSNIRREGVEIVTEDVFKIYP
jgi:hypothetical protein